MTRDNIIAIIKVIIIIIIVRLKLLNLRPAVYILMQKALMFNTCSIVSFGRTVN